MFALLSVLTFANAATPAAARASLILPVDCQVGVTCFIEQYFDHDPGLGRRDYRCGALLSDGHDGIDFRVRRNAGEVPVIAAAAGVVLRIRDAMPDRSVRGESGAVAADRMAGNGVVIDHGGLQTQYSHLKLGSVAVIPGQRIRAGQRIGTVGMSGNTEYLHMHFAVRRGGEPVDPFTGTTRDVACIADPPGSLWEAAARRKLSYQPSGVADGGFSPARPSVVNARAGSLALIGKDPPALVLWADSFGSRAGDEEQFVIRAPSGRIVLDRHQPIARTTLTWFSYAGIAKPIGGWKNGTYAGEYVLRRNGKMLGSVTTKTTLGSR